MVRTAIPLTCAVVVVTLNLGVDVAGLFIEGERRRVPVDRMVENLEKRAAAQPDDVRTLINLARLHGMAFATHAAEVPVIEQQPGVEEPWYGSEARLVPYRPRPAKTPEAAAVAREHLKKSISRYEEALALSPENPLALLGYGWMLDQAREKARAIEQYRKLISIAWPREKARKGLNPGERFYTHEATQYLLPLLDPQRDAGEIADLKTKQKYLDSLPRAITPIAVPLGKHVPSSQIADVFARVRFDADGSGLRRRWTWITPDAGWLVYDADGRGEITSALQLFGNVSFWLFWNNGYEALGSLDDNLDGVIDGAELRHLAIWHDRDGDGVSDRGEVAPVASHGIVAFSLEHCEGDNVRFAAMSAAGVRFANGSTRPTYDVILRADLR